MSKKINFKYGLGLAIFLFVVVFIVLNSNIVKSDRPDDQNLAESNITVEEVKDREERVEIVAESTYGQLMTDTGISALTANEIYQACLDNYDLAKIKLGHFLEFTYDKNTDDLKQLIYKIDSEDEVVATKTADGWQSEIKPIDYEVKVVTKEGEIETSVYQAALDNNIDERAIIELANAFQWSIDFAMDSRVGDKFRFVYEERYLNGEYVMPGKILAGLYINEGNNLEVYYFEENEDNKGYFDADGNSVQKMFLKAPVAFKYISSGFTTGQRYVEAFNVSTGHRAIDYAAPLGTPIRAVGDGKVVYATYNTGGYGNKVSVRHNGTYTTNYCHLSKFAVKYGDSVKQGDIIGYVGSTGFSTGPHLHYEMVKDGVKINPLKEVLPPGEPIKEENRDRFFSEVQTLKDKLFAE